MYPGITLVKDLNSMLKLKRLIIPFSCYIVSLALFSELQLWNIAPVLYIVPLYGGIAVINDIQDIEIDRKTNPDRPLPSGRINHVQAYLIASSLLLTVFAYSVFISRVFSVALFLLFPLSHLILGLLYSGYVSRNIFASMILLGFSHGLLLYLIGIYIFGSLTSISVAVGVAMYLLPALGYVIKDFKDYEGDRGIRKTLITVFGPERAKLITQLFFAILVFPVFLVYVLGGSETFLAAALLFWLGLMILAFSLERSEKPEDYELILDIFRWVMSAFILSFGLA
ncbi:MAG: UbiA prenyltransferase family protein [Candidatus Nanohaloarchaea archaeon]